MEIIIFIHNNYYVWDGVRCVKYATWSRPLEEITTIYNQNVGSHRETKVRFDKNTKKFYATPINDVSICDIYIQEFPATV
ncbi:hypothetical protein [uncultured Fusobacterium sp.]|uniref:hypothetical protein n=1 Tax=uncultured Fusobacterium sp. TaxID=159267 RepID=UPI0025E95216|nr:hypothetical protein [uncultured Fusobacterium sp.]